MGRRTKDTLQVRAHFEEGIRAGMSREAAAKRAGISPATLHRYLGGDGEEHERFRETLDRAEAELELSLVAVVMAHIPHDPRLAMAYLSRRFPADWGSGRPVIAEPPTESQVPAVAPVEVLIIDPAILEATAQRVLGDARARLGGPALGAADLLHLIEAGEVATAGPEIPSETDGAVE